MASIGVVSRCIITLPGAAHLGTAVPPGGIHLLDWSSLVDPPCIHCSRLSVHLTLAASHCVSDTYAISPAAYVNHARHVWHAFNFTNEFVGIYSERRRCREPMHHHPLHACARRAGNVCAIVHVLTFRPDYGITNSPSPEPPT